MQSVREEMEHRKRQLRKIVDEMTDVFEREKILLSNWKPYYHVYFINQILRLQQLESNLYALGYDDDFVLTVKQAIYRSVFDD